MSKAKTATKKKTTRMTSFKFVSIGDPKGKTKTVRCKVGTTIGDIREKMNLQNLVLTIDGLSAKEDQKIKKDSVVVAVPKGKGG